MEHVQKNAQAKRLACTSAALQYQKIRIIHNYHLRIVHVVQTRTRQSTTHRRTTLSTLIARNKMRTFANTGRFFAVDE